jgi:site-specific DNA-cytosine methylase
MLRPKTTTTFYGRQPGEKSHWSGEADGPWKPVAPTKVVEVRYDHFSDQRFRHGCTFLRVREDKLPKDCLLEQVMQRTLVEDINAFIEAGLATQVFRRIIREFEEHGYHVTAKILFAAHYGVPQERWRLILLGSQKSAIAPPEPTHYATGRANFRGGSTMNLHGSQILIDL